MNIVAFIPARGGSKSIPRKNIKELGGKPLIAYSIEQAFQSGIENIVVSTDDTEIASIAREYGADVLSRPAHLAGDKTPMLNVLRHEIDRITPRPQVVLLLQPTYPFREKFHIKTALNYLEENYSRFDSVVSVNKIPPKYHPAEAILDVFGNKRMFLRKLKTMTEKIMSVFTGRKYIYSQLPIFKISERMTRRQDYPEAWIPSGSIYLFKTANLEKGSIYGESTLLLETPEAVNINEKEDWEKAEEYLNKNYVKN